MSLRPEMPIISGWPLSEPVFQEYHVSSVGHLETLSSIANRRFSPKTLTSEIPSDNWRITISAHWTFFTAGLRRSRMRNAMSIVYSTAQRLLIVKSNGPLMAAFPQEPRSRGKTESLRSAAQGLAALCARHSTCRRQPRHQEIRATCGGSCRKMKQ